MKKKLLLIISMFLFVTNVQALSFNVNVTNIEDNGSDSLGTITKIDLEKREIDAFFEDIGSSIEFYVTVTNLGDRAGTLREINITGTNEKIEYSTNLPEGGMAINGNDTNKIFVTGRVKRGAVNGKSSTEIKITYTYDEGSCPEGEILSEDESMCLCPTGKVRTDKGLCEEPPKPIECEKDEVYNTQTKQCEKKVVPVTPDVPVNPKTLDNIILITLLFFVSGLGIYAVMFKRLKTNKKRVAVGVITGVATLGLSFTVLASVFGLDNLLSAIVNPITKTKELTVKVNEEIELIETWDGACELDVAELTPENIFEGGSGTEEDPYQIKTAEQLGCMAKSVNNGTTYQGKYIKQTKNIKLNELLSEKAETDNLNDAHVWTSAGYTAYDYNARTRIPFSGTYDGDNHVISGLYITDESAPNIGDPNYQYRGLFGFTSNASFKNMRFTDTYIFASGNAGPLVGYAYENLTIDNVFTYGKGKFNTTHGYAISGVVAEYEGNDVGYLTVTNVINNVSLDCKGRCAGVVGTIHSPKYDETNPNIVFKNVHNHGNMHFASGSGYSGGLVGYAYVGSGNALIEKCSNSGNFTFDKGFGGSGFGGLFGYYSGYKLKATDSYNTGNITGFNSIGGLGGIVADYEANYTYIENCYNSGNFTADVTGNDSRSYTGGILGSQKNSHATEFIIKNCFNTGDIYSPNSNYIGGMVGKWEDYSFNENRIIEDCYNTGDFNGWYGNGGIAGYFGGIIQRCYNTGDMVAKDDATAGILGYGGHSKIYNSYNEGSITIDHSGAYIGGICGNDCIEIKNCYNRGDLTVINDCSNVAGIIGQSGTVINSYNSGKIIYKNKTYVHAGGIGATTTVSNSYNLGDIEIEDAGNSIYIAGISTSGGSSTNSVNKGNITVTVKDPYTSAGYFSIGGTASYGTSTNSFNAGTIKVVNPDGTNYPITEDTFPGTEMWEIHHRVNIGEITGDTVSGSGNKFNTNANGKAAGCLINPSRGSSCTEAASEALGVYQNIATPDILSIINGDNAFEIKEGEELPTLKVFNQ